MAVDRIVRCRNWMRKIIDAPNVDGWQNMVDTPDDDFTDPDFADDVDKDVDKDEIKRKDFDSRYPEYVKKVMLKGEKYQGKEISDAEYEEYEKRISKIFLGDTKEISDAEYEEYERRRMSKNFLGDTKLISEKKEKEPEDKTLKEKKTEDNKILKEKESYEERQERYYKRFKESYEEKQERYFKRFEAMQEKYPYLTDTEISEKLIAEKDNDDLLYKAKKYYERIHGKNSFYVQIEKICKLTEKGINFDTAFKKCKFPYSYKKHVMKALQELKRYESITKT